MRICKQRSINEVCGRVRGITHGIRNVHEKNEEAMQSKRESLQPTWTARATLKTKMEIRHNVQAASHLEETRVCYLQIFNLLNTGHWPTMAYSMMS